MGTRFFDEVLPAIREKDRSHRSAGTCAGCFCGPPGAGASLLIQGARMVLEEDPEKLRWRAAGARRSCETE